MFLCRLSKSGRTVRAYLSDKDAEVGRIVKLKDKGQVSKGWKVEYIDQKIDEQFVEDNHQVNTVIRD